MVNNLTSNVVEVVNIYGHNLSHAAVYFLVRCCIKRHSGRRIYWAQTPRARGVDPVLKVGGGGDGEPIYIYIYI